MCNQNITNQTDKINEIVSDLKNNGISFSSVDELLGEESKKLFLEAKSYFDDFLSCESIKDRFSKISSGDPIQDKSKWFEVTVFEFLKRGLGLDDGKVIELNLCPEIISVAKGFYGETPKVRNILTWAHPYNPSQSEIGSQRWHRDKEDDLILKVFILFSKVGANNGPTQFIKKSQIGGENQNILDLDGDGYGSLKYEIPKGDQVSSEGEVGTLVFMNNNGVHKGGLVKEGVRCLTHACFLKSSANYLNNGVLPCFEYDPQVNILDRNSESFLSLSEERKFILS